MVEIRRNVHNSAFFINGLKMQMSIRLTTEINSVLATFLSLTVAIILLFSRTKKITINTMQSDIQNLQWQ